MDLGRVSAKSSGSTTFTVSPAGVVTGPTPSGTNYSKRTTTGNVSTPTVTIRCTDASGSSNKCAGKFIYVTFRGTTATGPATAPTAFTVSSAASVSSGPTGTTAITYKLNALTSGVSRSFSLGMDVPVKSSATLGAGTFGFSAAIGLSSPASSPIDTGTGAVYGIRPLALAKNSDLEFGRVVKPTSGSSELMVSIGNARTISGGDAVLIGTSFSRAQFTASGEGGQAISITAPTFAMTNGTGGSVTVTPILPAGLTGIGGTFGSAGTYNFFVGGKFTMTPTTPSGAYSGSFATTVAYN